MAIKKMEQNVLAIAFTAASGYTPAVGDLVTLTGAWEVGPCTANGFYLGTVVNVDKNANTPRKVVVGLSRFTALAEVRLDATELTAVGPLVAAGSGRVKAAVVANTEDENSGVTSVYRDHAYDIIGWAVEVGAGNAYIHALVF